MAIDEWFAHSLFFINFKYRITYFMKIFAIVCACGGYVVTKQLNNSNSSIRHIRSYGRIFFNPLVAASMDVFLQISLISCQLIFSYSLLYAISSIYFFMSSNVFAELMYVSSAIFDKK